jgi:hypothetical protein
MFEEDDDWLDFPPSRYPGREAFTFSLTLVCVIAGVTYGAWKIWHWVAGG